MTIIVGPQNGPQRDIIKTDDRQEIARDDFARRLDLRVDEDRRGVDLGPELPTNQAAERFNEHGFFGHSVAHPSSPSTPFQQRISDEAGVGGAGIAAALPQKDGIGIAAAAETHPRPILTLLRSGSASVCIRVADGPAISSVLPGSGIVNARGAAVSDEIASSTARSARPAPRSSDSGASSMLMVALVALADGIKVSARTGRLTHEERDRLREEIAALLASHGYALRDIALQARAPTDQHY